MRLLLRPAAADDADLAGAVAEAAGAADVHLGAGRELNGRFSSAAICTLCNEPIAFTWPSTYTLHRQRRSIKRPRERWSFRA